MRRADRRAFTLIELLVVIGVIGLLLSILLPAVEHVRHRSYIDVCANNLRQIGVAMSMYANENEGAYPRTTYDPSAAGQSGWTAGQDISPINLISRQAHTANDITAAVFLLARAETLPTSTFICPYNDVNVFTSDAADPQQQWNFSDYHKNLGYSFSDMYPNESAVQSGYKWSNRLGADFPLAADLNPGIHLPDDDPSAVIPDAPPSITAKGNSRNHEKEGQNVLYGDGHVNYEPTCLTGVKGDNIYTSRDNRIGPSPLDKDDALLLPSN